MDIQGAEGWDELEDWDGHVYTAMYQTDDWCKPTGQHKELCSELCGDLNEKEILKRGYMSMSSRSLGCAAENNAAL